MSEFDHPSKIPVEGVDSTKILHTDLQSQSVVPSHFATCRTCETVSDEWDDCNRRIGHDYPSMRRMVTTCSNLDSKKNTAKMQIVFTYAYSSTYCTTAKDGAVTSMTTTYYPGSTHKYTREVDCPGLQEAEHKRKFEAK